MSQLNNTPTDTLNLTYWERKDGYFKDGIFHCPRYAIFRKGERVTIQGKIKTAYPYSQANHILMHLQELSDTPELFTLEPIAWQPMTSSEVAA